MSATTIDLRLNAALDLASYAAMFRERGIVQIPNIFETESANALADLFVKQMPWRLTFIDGDKPVSYASAGVEEVGQAAIQAKMRAVMDKARRNIGYCYYAYPMNQAYVQGWDPGHPIHRVTELLNGPDFVELGRTISGAGDITKVEANATVFSPGQFLTRHIDHGYNEDKERRAAYVIGLTSGWEPDWGGLLLFINDKLDIAEGFLPRFNVITIFDTKYQHAVTQVTSFAGGGRYSISGWFTTDPPMQLAR